LTVAEIVNELGLTMPEPQIQDDATEDEGLGQGEIRRMLQEVQGRGIRIDDEMVQGLARGEQGAIETLRWTMEALEALGEQTQAAYDEMIAMAARITGIMERHRADYGSTIDTASVLREVGWPNLAVSSVPSTLQGALVVCGLLDEDRVSDSTALMLLSRWRDETRPEGPVTGVGGPASYWVARIRSVVGERERVEFGDLIERLGAAVWVAGVGNVIPPALQAALAVTGFLAMADVEGEPGVEQHLRALGYASEQREELLNRAMATGEGRAALHHVAETANRVVAQSREDWRASQQAPRGPTIWDRIMGPDDA